MQSTTPCTFVCIIYFSLKRNKHRIFCFQKNGATSKILARSVRGRILTERLSKNPATQHSPSEQQHPCNMCFLTDWNINGINFFKYTIIYIVLEVARAMFTTFIAPHLLTANFSLVIGKNWISHILLTRFPIMFLLKHVHPLPIILIYSEPRLSRLV